MTTQRFCHRRLIAAFALACVLAGPRAGAAQPREERHKWWLSERVMAEVGLTTEQSNEIEQIFQSMMPRLRTEKSDLDRREQDVSRLMLDAPGDETRVVQAVEQVEGARAACNTTRTLMLFKMYRVLTPEQRVKLKEYRERQERDRRGAREPGGRLH